MMQASKHWITHNSLVTPPYSMHVIFSRDWNMLIDALMRSGVVEICDIVANETI